MSPWCATAVLTVTGRALGSPLVFAWGAAPRRCHSAKPPRTSTASISQIHQRLPEVGDFTVLNSSDLIESVASSRCSVTCTPQAGQRKFSDGDKNCAPLLPEIVRNSRAKKRPQVQSNPGASKASYAPFYYPFDVRKRC